MTVTSDSDSEGADDGHDAVYDAAVAGVVTVSPSVCLAYFSRESKDCKVNLYFQFQESRGQ